MIKPLVEIYQDPVIHREASYYTDVWRRDSTLERSLERAGALATLNTPEAIIEHVEGLPEFDHDNKRQRAACLLGCLPSTLLLHNFGEEVTGWTLANDDRFRTDKLMKGLEDEGYEADLLEKARLLAWEEHNPPRGRDVIKQNLVMERVLGGTPGAIDLPALLQTSSLEGSTLSQKRLADYALIPLRADGGSFYTSGRVHKWPGQELANKPGLEYSIWLDTPVGVALTYKNIPQATLGVVASGTDTLEIRQLQKMYGKTYDPSDPHSKFDGIKQPRGLMPIDWQKLMVGIATVLADSLGKSKVGILAGRKIPSRDCNITREKAEAAYDAPAERFGFSQNGDGDWRAGTSHLIELLAQNSIRLHYIGE